LSLAFSLASALSATLVEQWVRLYLEGTERRTSVHERARVNAYLHEGIKQFRMNSLVKTIPTLLHASLLLFFAGLVEFLRPVNKAISYLILGILIVCLLLYIGITILPSVYLNSPFRTPLSGVWWRLVRPLRWAGPIDFEIGHSFPTKLVPRKLKDLREIAALRTSTKRDERDFDAMV
jgi:hypothetical protein